MFSILTWSVYGIFVGSIAKAIIPGEENFGFIRTIALGVAGSYMGGAILYLLGSYSAVEPAGIFMGIGGSCVALLLYNKLVNK
jgi:uncharacterized membrane protein YeaQ/YmgE (transglycosylase-associated protein family)|tara:strand:- start:76 stop:324 length:249 start_codon:yes stop_codon:yes gene_type:complete